MEEDHRRHHGVLCSCRSLGYSYYNNNSTSLRVEILFWKCWFTFSCMRWGRLECFTFASCLSPFNPWWSFNLPVSSLNSSSVLILRKFRLKWTVSCFSAEAVTQTSGTSGSVSLHLTQVSLRRGPCNLTGVANGCRFGHPDGLGNHWLAWWPCPSKLPAGGSQGLWKLHGIFLLCVQVFPLVQITLAAGSFEIQHTIMLARRYYSGTQKLLWTEGSLP